MNTQRNGNGGVKEPTLVLEVIDDPAIAESIRAQIERGRRNLKWLSSHWDEVLPQARGRFVAVAGQETHVSDTPEEAWAWAKRFHPEDDGALVQYVRPEGGPRIYAHRGHLAQM
jgi:hypothetical protein